MSDDLDLSELKKSLEQPQPTPGQRFPEIEIPTLPESIQGQVPKECRNVENTGGGSVIIENKICR